MYKDIEQSLAEKRGAAFREKYIHGLPVGLELPSGIVIGQEAWDYIIGVKVVVISDTVKL